MVLEDLRMDGTVQNILEQEGRGARPWVPSARCGGGGRSGEKMIAWWSEGVQEKMGRPRARVQVPTSESEGPGASPQACLCFCISHGPGSFVSFGEE